MEKALCGLYVHVPFCRSRCAYCDFYSTSGLERLVSAFVQAAGQEMLARHREVRGLVPTVYIGGGTPSVLPIADLVALLSAVREVFPVTVDAEVTVEVNPDDVTPALAGALKDAGVNRVSMGVQTFDDDLLRFLRRRHTGQAAVDAISYLVDEGIDNVSADLIYGLPGQTEDGFRADVERLCSLSVTHLSAYALSYEPGTPLSLLRARGEVRETPEDVCCCMYSTLIDCAASAGFEQYEISNFARPGFRSRHNSAYWIGRPYVGIGPGAHSFDGHRVRRYNLPNLQAYIAAAGRPQHGTEHLSDDEQYNELVMTRLRTREGLPIYLLTENDREYLMKNAASHLAAGRLVTTNDALRLTRTGLFVSDGVMADLMRLVEE